MPPSQVDYIRRKINNKKWGLRRRNNQSFANNCVRKMQHFRNRKFITLGTSRQLICRQFGALYSNRKWRLVSLYDRKANHYCVSFTLLRLRYDYAYKSTDNIADDWTTKTKKYEMKNEPGFVFCYCNTCVTRRHCTVYVLLISHSQTLSSKITFNKIQNGSEIPTL